MSQEIPDMAIWEYVEDDDRAWIGVDLDGTLAEYHGWRDDGGIGKPVPIMVTRIKDWLANDKRVKIMTARVATPNMDEYGKQVAIIRDWLKGAGLPEDLEITCIKDMRMVELWDDRAVRVILNTGRISHLPTPSI